jgi:hypothetical protein
MNTPLIARSLFAATVALSLNSMAAETMPAEKMKEMLTVNKMDANKDGMVSRAEFVDMMGKIYDMKAKDMGAKGGKLSATQVEDFRRALAAAAGGQ